MVIGDPNDAATQVGPLASADHYRKVRGYVETVESEGGKIRTGGLGDGWVVRPTVVVDMPATARHVREEIFGPVVIVTPFDTEGETAAMVNDSPYGLNAMLFTENLHRSHRVSAALEAAPCG